MENPTIIIDNGSGYIKAGLNTYDEPSLIFPTLIGHHRHQEHSELFVGYDALKNELDLSIYHPIDHGHISNWDYVEKIWDYTLKNVGFGDKIKDVLLTEPPLSSTHHRTKMGEMFFEHFKVENLNMSVSGLMSIYANGITTGMVLDIGEGITQCMCLFDGYIEKNSVIRSDFGGEELTMYLQKLICDNGYTMTTRRNFEYVKTMKETLCFCSLHPAIDQNREDLSVTYKLPDGDVLRDGYDEVEISHERFYVPEALFNPTLCHRDNPSITDIVCRCLQNSPIQNRKVLSSCIVLSGGSTLFPNLAERLETEVKNKSPSNARSTIKVYAHEKRAIMAWYGAKIFSNQLLRSSQQAYWISKEEYEDIGPNIFLTKSALNCN